VHAGYPPDAAAVFVELEVTATRWMLSLICPEAGDRYFTGTGNPVAQDDSERMRIWKGRKGAFSAVGRLSPDYLVQDGVVPRGRLEALEEIVNYLKYGLRWQMYSMQVMAISSADSVDGRTPGVLEKAENLAGEILMMCIRYGGSITGEHGIGVEKRHYLPAMFNKRDIAAMQRLRWAFDPQEIANRGKVFLPA
jgi:glycolate oxidase